VLGALAPVALAQQTRDGGGIPTGHALLSGVVIASEAQRDPVRRAIVTLTAPELPQGRTTISDESGRFTFANLPAGRYTLSASKAAYLTMAYGSTRPGRPGVVIPLGADQQMTDVALRLPRGSVIAGEIHDDRGGPAVGVQVAVVRAPRSASDTALTFLTSATTDDRGAYRVFGLAPGDYLVFAGPPRAMGAGDVQKTSTAAVDAALLELQQQSSFGRTPARPSPETLAELAKVPHFGYAPVFFPGTPVAADATRVTVGEGEELTSVSFALTLVPTATISGVVTGGGAAIATQLTINPLGARIQMTPGLIQAGSLPMSPALSQPPGADGVFRYSSVPPGQYTIIARARPAAATSPASAASQTQWAMVDVDVRGDDISGVTLALQPAMQLSGRITFDAFTLTPPDDLSRTSVSLRDVKAMGTSVINGTAIGLSPIPPGQVRPDGVFEIGGVLPGAYTMAATLPGAPGWWLRSAMLKGRDLLDAPVEFGVTGNVTGVVLTFTDRHGELSGALRDAANRPASGYVVVVFPADRAYWRLGSRRLRSARPATDGKFSFKDLPGGAYLIAAVTDVDPADLGDPALIEQLLPGAVKVNLGDGDTKVQDLRVGR
jgi:uncharacterized protein (DUF2141 family)/sarcosine oxidase gamma subunit